MVANTNNSSDAEQERKMSWITNMKGRKVTRQGDFVVITEKVGLVTSQSGVQLVREERVHINSEDYDRLVKLGF